MWKNDPLLPVTVTDQIRLWERERNRVVADAGSLYTDFTSQADFELVRNYAKESGVMLWQDEDARKFFVTTEGCVASGTPLACVLIVSLQGRSDSRFHQTQTCIDCTQYCSIA